MTETYAKKPTDEYNQSDKLLIELRKQINRIDGGGNPESLYRDVSRLVKDIGTYTSEHIPVKMIDDLDDVEQPIEIYQIGNIFNELNAPGYSLIRDALIVIGAEANTGKSSILTALSLDLLKHNKNMAAVIYSLDDGTYITKRRILSQIKGIDYTAPGVRFNKTVLTKDDKELLSRIVIKDRFPVIDDLEREAVKIKTLCGADKIIIGIDYLQIIPNTDTKQDYDFLNGTVKQLKEIHKSLAPEGCIMFVLSQLARSREGKTFSYRGTSEIENQADVCLDLSAKMIKVTDKDDAGKPVYKVDPSYPNKRFIKVSKNKLGKKGMKWGTNFHTIPPDGTDYTFTPLTVQRDDEGDSITAGEEDEADNYKRRLR